MLDDTTMYMNPVSGTVATGKEWMDDFAQEEGITFEEWCPVGLIEVEWNVDTQEWVQV